LALCGCSIAVAVRLTNQREAQHDVRPAQFEATAALPLDRFRWVFWIACQVIYGLAVLLTAMVFWELENERMFRFVAMISIIDAALTLVIPLLHRISRTDGTQARAAPQVGSRLSWVELGSHAPLLPGPLLPALCCRAVIAGESADRLPMPGLRWYTYRFVLGPSEPPRAVVVVGSPMGRSRTAVRESREDKHASRLPADPPA